MLPGSNPPLNSPDPLPFCSHCQTRAVSSDASKRLCHARCTSDHSWQWPRSTQWQSSICTTFAQGLVNGAINDSRSESQHCKSDINSLVLTNLPALMPSHCSPDIREQNIPNLEDHHPNVEYSAFPNGRAASVLQSWLGLGPMSSTPFHRSIYTMRQLN